MYSGPDGDSSVQPPPLRGGRRPVRSGPGLGLVVWGGPPGVRRQELTGPAEPPGAARVAVPRRARICGLGRGRRRALLASSGEAATAPRDPPRWRRSSGSRWWRERRGRAEVSRFLQGQPVPGRDRARAAGFVGRIRASRRRRHRGESRRRGRGTHARAGKACGRGRDRGPGLRAGWDRPPGHGRTLARGRPVAGQPGGPAAGATGPAGRAMGPVMGPAASGSSPSGPAASGPAASGPAASGSAPPARDPGGVARAGPAARTDRGPTCPRARAGRTQAVRPG